jgi:hypothetical protein
MRRGVMLKIRDRSGGRDGKGVSARRGVQKGDFSSKGRGGVRRGECKRGKEVKTNLQVVQERELCCAKIARRRGMEWKAEHARCLLYAVFRMLLYVYVCYRVLDAVFRMLLYVYICYYTWVLSRDTPLIKTRLIGVAAVARKSPTLPQGPSLVTLVPPVHPILSHLSCFIL